MEKKIRWIALQPLLGGMSIGAEKAFGTPPAMILNYDGVANTSAYVHYMNNVRKLNIPYYEFEGDIYSNSKTFKNNANPDFNDIDVVSAVPICSGLSTANAVNDKTKENARGANAKQNNNMLNCTEFTLGVIKPKCYIFENAPGLFTNAGKGVRDKLDAMAKRYGYSVTYVKTNTCYHHNVQWRTRTFAIFTKGKNATFYKVDHSYKGTIKDYLSSITPDAAYQDVLGIKDFEHNGWIKYMVAKYGIDYRKEWEKTKLPSVSGIIINNNDEDFACRFMTESQQKQTRHARKKYDMGLNHFDNSPCYFNDHKVCTIFGRTYTRLLHAYEERGYNMRELLTFMGMPNDFEWPDAEKKINWIGQNVPVMTAYDWHLQIKEFLEGKLSTSDEQVIKLDNTKQKKEFKFGYSS